MPEAKLTIEWEGKSIIIEGSPDFVRHEAELFRTRHSKSLEIQSEDKSKRPSSAAETISEKKPRGHAEIIAVLAYYLASEGSDFFTEDEMKRAYIQAKIRPPKVMAQAIRDSKNKYDFVEPGKTRGSYTLSVHGRRTVEFDLPRAVA